MTTTPSTQAEQQPRRDPLIYADELAEILRRSPAAVRYMVHAGTAPPSAKIGGRRVWRLSEVHAWIDAQFEAAE